MYFIKFALPILMAANAAHAIATATTGSFVFNGVTKFISADTCKSYYAKSVTPVAGQTATSYCADKIMTLLEACTATNIAQYLSSNNIANFTDLTNTDQLNLKSKYQYQCQVNAQKDTAAAAAAKATSSTSGVTSSAAGLAAAAAGVATVSAAAKTFGATNPAQTTQALSQITQQAVNSAEAYDAAKAQAQKTANQISPAADQNGNVGSTGSVATMDKSIDSNSATIANNSAASSTTSGAAPSATPSSLSDYSDAAKFASPSGSTASTSSAASSTGNPNYYSSSSNAGDPSAVVANGKAAEGQMSSAAADTNNIPEIQNQVKNIQANANGGGATAPATDITANANTADSAIESGLAAAKAARAQLAAGGLSLPFAKTVALIDKYENSVRAYLLKKKICSKSAEAASYLCLESSPGLQAAKQLMSVATPVLSLISSAQKNCSSTAKITKLVNLGLTVTEGACVAAKVTCDTACATSSTTIKQLDTQFATDYPGTVALDQMAATKDCAKYEDPYTMEIFAQCNTETANRTAASQTANTQYREVLAKEDSQAPGTSPALTAKCTSLAKDVALLAVQVLQTYTALQSAKSCEAKLASTGSTAITTQQYCEKSENVSQQICICQKTPTAAGCPGAVAATGATPASGADKGANIQALAGNSAFGGAFKPTTPNSALSFANGGGGKNGFGNPTSAGANAQNGLAGGGSPSGAAGGSEGGGLSAPGGSSSGSEAAKNAANRKDVGFGSYGAVGGGLGGFGGGYGSASGLNGASGGKSGPLTARDREAIRRQIASEQLSAEVSTASGKSNWEKVRSMYLNKENSFFGQ